MPQAFQLAHRAAGNGVAIPLVEVMIAQVHIVLALVNNAVADDGDAVGLSKSSENVRLCVQHKCHSVMPPWYQKLA